MKKILMVSGAINYGAPGRIVEQIGLLAKECGYDVLVAHSSRNENPSQLAHFNVTSKANEICHALGSMFLDLHGLMSSSQTKYLVEKIKEFNPDIIHLHNIHGYFLNFKILFEFLSQIDTPIVWTLHDCWAFTGRCTYFEGVKCNKWKSACYDCNVETGYTVSKYVDRSSKLFDIKKYLFSKVKNLTIVPVSNWLANYVKESFLSNKRLEIIHNGINLSNFQPRINHELRQKLKLSDQFVVLGVASPWNYRKGLTDFVKLSSLLDSSYVIILIGLTNKQIKSLPKNIIGISRTESQVQLAEYYTLADVFCNFTYSDNFPTVNLEALACGTPVITYRTGGSPEAVDNKTGIVVEQGDLDGVVDSLKKMRKYPLSSNGCRERAEKLYDKDSCFYKYIELYNSILG